MRLAFLLVMVVMLGGCATTQHKTIEEQLAHRVVFTIANDITNAPTILTSYSHASFEDLEPVLVKKHSQTMIDRVLRFHRLRKIQQWTIKSLGLEAVVAEFKTKRELQEVISALRSDDRVESVQSVKAYRLLAYNDPYFELQSVVRSDNIESIHRLATGKDVVVAIVDTGMDRRHPEIAERIIYSRNLVAHDPVRFDQDEHGTAVAGIIGSSANNKLGIVGVAPDVKLMGFKACWETRGTRQAQCDSVSLMKALVDVIDQQPDIVNLSLAGPNDPLLQRLLKAASDQGIVIVAALDSKAEQSFPASMPEVIAVGTSQGLNWVADSPGVLAPGTDVLTTTPGATYAFKSGSSMATAYVSGIAALMKERQPTLSGEQIRVHLRNTASSDLRRVPVVNLCAAVSMTGESCAAKNSVVMVTD